MDAPTRFREIRVLSYIATVNGITDTAQILSPLCLGNINWICTLNFKWLNYIFGKINIFRTKTFLIRILYVKFQSEILPQWTWYIAVQNNTTL